MTATIKAKYDPAFYAGLEPIAQKAKELMSRHKGGAGQLKANLLRSVTEKGTLEDFQIKKLDGGSALRFFTFKELAESAENEVTAQTVDPAAVNEILFGRYGLIQKIGKGRAERLMEDIEVAFVKDLVAGTSVGPIITSGRHRTLALQILLQAAGIQGYQDVKVRCSVILVNTQDEIQHRIISANTGSRDFSRAEIRERQGSTSGIYLFSCESIDSTILAANREADFKAAFSAYLKHTAADLQLNFFTPAQYSDAGNSLWVNLGKLRPQGKTVLKWIMEDKEARFKSVMSAAKAGLPAAVVQAQRDPSHGNKATKIARALVPMIQTQCF